MKLTKIGLAASLIAGMSFANASDFEFGLQTGYSSGGDAIGELGFDAGDGLSIGAFAIKQLTENGLGIKVAVNYMQETGIVNSTLSRFPIDLLVLKRINNLQLAAGLTYHLAPSLNSDDTDEDTSGNTTTTNVTRDLDNEIGFVLEANYSLSESFSLGARYTNIEYSFEDTTITGDYDGSNVAITAAYTF